MTTLISWPWALAVSLLSTIVAASLLPVLRRNALAEARLRSVRLGGIGQSDRSDETLPIWVRALTAVGRMVLDSGLLSRAAVEDLAQTMAASGNRTGPALGLFVGAKLCFMVGLPALAWLTVTLLGLHINVILVAAAFGMVGLMLPDFLVRARRRRYLKAVDVGLPSALDLLIICAEAGLALEAGLERVSEDLKEAAPATANELRLTANEMKILADRRQALLNMGTRTGLPTMSRLGSVLTQTLKYGTPLTQALRVLAVELRQITLNRFEARAARIPVLLTLPMVLFILPCMFVVIAGPSAVRVIQTFHLR